MTWKYFTKYGDQIYVLVNGDAHANRHGPSALEKESVLSTAAQICQDMGSSIFLWLLSCEASDLFLSCDNLNIIIRVSMFVDQFIITIFIISLYDWAHSSSKNRVKVVNNQKMVNLIWKKY